MSIVDLENSGKFFPKKIKISIIGLGYVGLPLAVEFGKKFTVIGYDQSSLRVSDLKKGRDHTGEVEKKSLPKVKI